MGRSKWSRGVFLNGKMEGLSDGVGEGKRKERERRDP